jgi:hypothetical protein
MERDVGISTHVYAVYGVRVAWNDEFSEAHELVYDDDDLPDMIFDGMSGEYMMLGHILFDSGDFRWGFENGDVMKTIDSSLFGKIEADYRAAFALKFTGFEHLLAQPFELHVFLHWS